jgi:hypothetical protein
MPIPPSIQFPERHHTALVDFLGLSPDQVAAFQSTIREEKPDISISKLARTLAERLGINRGRIDKIILMLGGMQRIMEELGLSVNDFVAELRAAIEASGKKDLLPHDWSIFEKNISEALSDETALSVSLKAADVVQDHARYYCSARVLTDLRPIFRSKVEEAPPVFVTAHSLKIEYHEGGQHLAFFVALDRNDIKQLAGLLERALRKEESLKELTTGKGIEILEVNS